MHSIMVQKRYKTGIFGTSEMKNQLHIISLMIKIESSHLPNYQLPKKFDCKLNLDMWPPWTKKFNWIPNCRCTNKCVWFSFSWFATPSLCSAAALTCSSTLWTWSNSVEQISIQKVKNSRRAYFTFSKINSCNSLCTFLMLIPC